MQRCTQTAGQSVLEHGFSVNRYFHDLIQEQPTLEWRLPDWFSEHRQTLLDRLHSLDVIDRYTVYHDCGKPYCRVLDEQGQHFPNHAALSRQIYLDLTGDTIAADLIGWDMVLHVCTAKQLDEYLKLWSLQDRVTLLLVALSEIHSNARMFDGVGSTSFKIKWKRLNKRGKQILKSI